MKEIKFDAVIIGAMGFTGKWVLDQMTKTGLKLAAACRSAQRLDTLKCENRIYFHFFFIFIVLLRKNEEK